MLKIGICALLLLGFSSRLLAAEQPPFKTVVRGSPVELEWRIDWQPPAKIHCIKIGPRQGSTNEVVRWAKYFGLTNRCESIPANLTIAPGWWVRDFTDNTRLKWRVTYFSQRENCLAYASGDNGYRWDLKRREPLFRDVPSRDDAVILAEKLVSELGVDCLFAKRANGQLMSSQRVQATGFFRRDTTNYQEVVQQQGVYLYQKVGDGTLLGDELGTVLVRFVSDRKVSDIEVKVVREREKFAVSALSKPELIEKVRKGKAWVFPGLNIGTSVEVIGADIVYPAAGRWQSETLRPFYRLHLRKQGESEREFLFVEATR